MNSETKYFFVILALWGLGSIIVQSLIIPFITVLGWRPDVVLIIVLFTGRRFGSLQGSSAGFILGLIQDSLTGMPVGISALPKAIAGYATGKLHNRKVEGIYNFVWFALLILMHELITYFFFQFKTELSYTLLAVTRAFPNTVYTFLLLVVSVPFTKKYFAE